MGSCENTRSDKHYRLILVVDLGKTNDYEVRNLKEKTQWHLILINILNFEMYHAQLQSASNDIYKKMWWHISNFEVHYIQNCKVYMVICRSAFKMLHWTIIQSASVICEVQHLKCTSTYYWCTLYYCYMHFVVLVGTLQSLRFLLKCYCIFSFSDFLLYSHRYFPN